MKNLSFFFALLFCFAGIFSFGQNVGISPSGNTPDASAGLDINFTDKGLLIPRVSLVNTTSAGPVTEPATSLLVYNTAAAGDVTPGYYFWNGTTWTRLSAPAGWSLMGNAGTVSGTNFIGTTDNIGIDFRTNNVLRTRITAKGAIETFNTGNSVFIGEGAGANDDMTNKFNVFIGYQSGNMNINGLFNTAVGNNTLNLNTAGHSNTAVGSNALMFNSGSYNTANGMNSLMYNTTGEENSAIGAFALGSNTTGWQNTASGSRALSFNTTGSNNTADGSSALMSNTIGHYNTATGSYSLYSNITGTENTSNGFQALFSNTSGEQNIGVGSMSLRYNTTGYLNTANGVLALYNSTTGCYNTSHGGWTLMTNTEGYFNSAFGYGADVASGNLNNATAIGAFALAGADNSLVLGSINGINGAPASVNVGIGTTTPTARLHVVGTVMVADGTQGANKVLTSDANGLASWQAPTPLLSAWLLTGNAGTLPGTNFIGTTDDAAFDIRTNNALRTRITTKGTIETYNTGYSVFIGQYAGANDDLDNNFNAFVGYLAGYTNTSGSYNTANGSLTLSSNTTGYENTANGSHSLSLNTTGNYNSAIGNNALYNNTKGSNNTALGSYSLISNIKGYANTALGSSADVASDSLHNATAIGYRAYAGANNSMVLGSIAGVNYALESVNVGIGTTTPSARLDVVGQVKIEDGTQGVNKVLTSDANGLASWQESELTQLSMLQPAGCFDLSGSASTGPDPRSIAYSENYTYLVSVNALTIYDVSSPSNPYQVGSASTGSTPTSVAVSGNYAYVTNGGSHSFYIYDVSNPSSPSQVGSVSTGSTPYCVAILGNYAYVANYGSNTLTSYDISNPSSPYQVGSVSTDIHPYRVAVSGNYAYVVNQSSNTMTIYHVGNPENLIQAGSVSTGSNPMDVAVSGIYAYVTNHSSNTMTVYDVSNPNSPYLVGSASFGAGSGPKGIAVSGIYAYVVNNYINTMNIFDVSTPASPFLVNSISTGNYPWDVAVSNNYAYVINFDSQSMQVFQVKCTQMNIEVQNGEVVLNSPTWLSNGDHIYNLNTGNVGIGTSNPTGDLHIESTGDVTVVLNADTDNNAGGEADNPRIELHQDGGGVIGAIGLSGSNNALHPGDLQNAFYLVEEYSEGALQLGTNNEIKMTILPNGYIGIGTNAPKAPLHVALATATTPFSSTSVTYTRITPTLSQSGQTGGLNTVNSLVSFVAEGDIVCKGTLTVASGIYFSSDKRLKDIQGISNSLHDLDILKKIQVTDYTMKDRVTWGFSRYKKAIAQQVEEVFPQAITKTTGYIPNIYEFAIKVGKTDNGFLVTMEKPVNCKAGDKIRFELENKGTVEADILNVVNDNQFEVAAETDISTGELFVFGLQVDDLRTVDYDAISMLNVSATQELARKLELAEGQIEAQNIKIAELSNQNRELNSKIGQIQEYLEMSSQK